jgi:hypothetical protein
MIIFYNLQLLLNQSPPCGGSFLASHHSGDYDLSLKMLILVNPINNQK